MNEEKGSVTIQKSGAFYELEMRDSTGKILRQEYYKYLQAAEKAAKEWEKE